MATLAKLAVELSLTDKFSQGLNKTKDNLDKWGESLRQTGSKFTLGVTVPVVAGFGLMIKSASDLNEATSATATVFKSSSMDIIRFANKSADAYGITKQQALEAATTLGQLAMGVGITEKAATKMGIAMISAAGDLASFRNADPSDVLADIQSGLVGQYEPLLKYGIVLNEATVAQKAMEMSGKANVDQLTNADKVLARSTLITEGLGAAQGDAARTANSLANVIRRLRARGKDLAAKWGQLLLPMVLRFSQFLIRITEALEKLSPKMQILIMVGLALAAAIGPVLIALGLMLPALSVLLGPVGLIIVAVGLLAAAFATDFMGIRGAIGSVLEPLLHLWTYMKLAFTSGTKVSQLVAFLPGPLKQVGKGFLLIADAVGDLVSAFKSNGFSGLLDALPGELDQVWEGLSILAAEGFGKLKEAFLSIPWAQIGLDTLELGKTAFNAIPWGDIWSGITEFGSAGWGKIKALFNAVPWTAVGQSVVTLGKTAFTSVPWGDIWSGITDLFGGLKTSFDEYDYNQLGVTVGEGIKTAITTAGPVLIGIGQSIIGSIKTGLEGVTWTEVLKWVALIPIAIPLAIIGAAEALIPKGKDFIEGLFEGLGINWETVTTWFNTRDEAALNAIGDLTETLLQKGKDILDGFRDGASDQWNVFKTWISNRGTIAFSAIGDLIDTLETRGNDLIDGLADGALEQWDVFTEWLADFATDIPEWVGDLSGILLQAGRDAVQGLIDGAEEKVPGLQTVVDTLIGIWNQIPGLGHSPWPMMIGAGKDAVDGLIIGADSRMDKLNDTIGNVTSAMLATMSADSGSTAPTYNGGITINVSGAGDPNTVADRVFAKFAREMALTTGGV